MIRITLEETNENICLSVEGKLSGPWVAELETAAQTFAAGPHPKALAIDLSSVSGMDASGRSLLTRLRAEGVRLLNLDPLSESLLKMDVAA